MKRIATFLLTSSIAAFSWAQSATPPAPAAAGATEPAPAADTPEDAAFFKRLDTNGDGKISTEESANHKHLNKGFGKADADGDGTISRDELRKARVSRKKDSFGKMDANKDGSIEHSELKGGQNSEARFNKADSNADGSVTKQEAKTMRDEKKAEFKDNRNSKP
jgi:EF hand